MTEHSGNGWTASAHLATRPLVVNGVAFLPGIRDDDDVATVLGYVATQYAYRVEPLHNPGCWGYSYRANRNDPNSLSNHASGTAIDCNAPAHPNGTPPTHSFTPDQITECHAIVRECAPAIRWGGDYTHTLDPMHWEVNCDAAELHVVAERLRDDMPYTEEQLTAIVQAAAQAAVDASWAEKPQGSKLTRDQLLKQAQASAKNAAKQ